jgi:hypothetical protein
MRSREELKDCMQQPPDIIDDIIAHLEPEDVPFQYIVMAKIIDMDGTEHIVKGDALEEMLNNPNKYHIAEARVILNVKKLRKAIIEEVGYFFDEVNRMLDKTLGGDEDE